MRAWWWLVPAVGCRVGTVSEIDASPPAATAAVAGPNLVLLPSVPETGLPEGRVRARHIVILKAKRTKEEARRRIDEVMAKLGSGADFAELAREYGEDATRVRGGDLGVFSRTDMVAPVADAAFALKVFETSGVVETDHGLHIIQRVE